jgi:hypothetical protein
MLIGTFVSPELWQMAATASGDSLILKVPNVKIIVISVHRCSLALSEDVSI